jgi:hypothetical protein
VWILQPKGSQSSGCHTISPNKPKKFRETLSAFQKADGMFSGTGKECSWWNSCIKGPQEHQKCILKRADRTQTLLEHFNLELFDNPPYSPDLAPTDYHLFT